MNSNPPSARDITPLRPDIGESPRTAIEFDGIVYSAFRHIICLLGCVESMSEENHGQVPD